MNRRQFVLTGAAGVCAPSLLLLAGCNTNWVATAEKDLPVIANIATSLATLALTASGNGILSPADQALIQSCTQAVQTGLTTLGQIISDLGKNPSANLVAKASVVITDIQTSLSQILSSIHVKNTALVNTVAAGVALAISTLSSIQLLIPPAVSPNPAAKRTLKASFKGAQVQLLTPEQIASMYNAVCVQFGNVSAQVNSK